MDIISIITEHNLSIRRIPNIIPETYDIRHIKEGDEIITIGTRRFCRRYRTPTHAGWFLCKPVNDTMAAVSWKFETDNLAPTLEQSIQMFLDKLS